MTETKQLNKTNLDELFKHGAHFGFEKSRRHPTAENFIYGSKNRVDIFDLEKTQEQLNKAISFVSSLASNKGSILFVGGKSEAKDSVQLVAESLGMPYVASRWIGGTLTNFSQVKKRVDTMLDLLNQKDKGELSKYTKKERLLIDRDIAKLQKMFGGIVNMISLPKALFIVDPRFEKTALKEAHAMKIPVIALCGSDNNFDEIDFPIPGNDSNRTSISYFVNEIKRAYIENTVKS